MTADLPLAGRCPSGQRGTLSRQRFPDGRPHCVRERVILHGTTMPALRRGKHPTLPPSGLPAISPARGEIGSVDFGALLPALVIGEIATAGRSPLAGEMSGRTERGAKKCPCSQFRTNLISGEAMRIAAPRMRRSCLSPSTRKRR